MKTLLKKRLRDRIEKELYRDIIKRQKIDFNKGIQIVQEKLKKDLADIQKENIKKLKKVYRDQKILSD